MRIVCKTYWLPKDGNSLDDYEDAAFPEAVDEETQRFDCAIADGATESSFSGLWARLLVNGLRQASDVGKLRTDFQTAVAGKSLEWYAEEKLSEGAFAALAVLSLTEETENDGVLKIQAIGDCCVTHWRQGELIDSFPISDPEAFNNSPILLSSSLHGRAEEDKLQTDSKRWCTGDKFFLMTDAIACWSLKRHRDSADAFAMLDAVDSLDALKQLVESQRKITDDDMRPYLKNDDVTLMKIEIKSQQG